ncbi:MAG: alpha-L-fucosidase, partial [Planctomycetota bacterium]|nr:alpha-L-fucosidase [Planctomycetota bacterium]
MPQWFGKAYKGLHLDFHTPEFLPDAIVNFDPDRWAANIVRSGADYANIFAKCHYGISYYRTAVGHIHSGLKADLLGELTSRLKAAGVGVVAYYSVNTDLRASLEHPDWTQVDAAGKPLLTEGRWRDVCFNSPYFRQLMLPQ